eukprot:scaffold151548_cov34-Tisochrysis_lutea.AAC.1
MVCDHGEECTFQVGTEGVLVIPLRVRDALLDEWMRSVAPQVQLAHVCHFSPPNRALGVTIGRSGRLKDSVHDGAAISKGAHTTNDCAVWCLAKSSKLSSCALGGACAAARLTARRINPDAPAAGSAWPLLALMLPTSNALSEPPRAARMAPARDPASIGSPKPVPVPWASQQAMSLAVIEASASAARSKPCCAMPLGAVKEADLPSWRTQLPRSEKCTVASASVTRRATPQMASPRA